MKFKNVFILSLMLLLFSFSASDLLAQNEWQHLRNVEGVDLFYKLTPCGNGSKILTN